MTVAIDSNGSFTPQEITISNNTVVNWVYLDRGDTVIPAHSNTHPAICSSIKPYSASGFAGPRVEAPSGIFTLGPFDRGLVKVDAAVGCLPVDDRIRATSANGQKVLCRDGEMYKTMNATWNNPDVTGVFISIPWNVIHIARGSAATSFDFTILDREIRRSGGSWEAL